MVFIGRFSAVLQIRLAGFSTEFAARIYKAVVRVGQLAVAALRWFTA